MLCEQCGVKEAEINIISVVNGERRVLHLCRECAEDRLRLDNVTNIVKMSFSTEGLKDIEQAFRDLLMPVLHSLPHEPGRHICPHCGGLLPDSMFGKEEQEEKKQEISQEYGVMNAEEELTELSKRMAAAVKEENYEFAARLRDRITELKESTAKNGA